jgi:hypothetical protein
MTTTSQSPQTAASSRLLMGYMLGGLGSILFATKSIAIKLAYAEGVDTETLLALRMLLSLPFYLVIGFVSLRGRQAGGAEPLGRGLIVKAGLVGILSYWFASYTDFLGLNYISAQLERLILFTYPLFTVLFGAVLLPARAPPRLVGLRLLLCGPRPDLRRRAHRGQRRAADRRRAGDRVGHRLRALSAAGQAADRPHRPQPVHLHRHERGRRRGDRPVPADP